MSWPGSVSPRRSPTPVPKRGITRLGRPLAIPFLAIGFVAAVAIVLHPVAVAGLAYVGGTLGTLVGADLLNMHKIRRLGAPVASIGGAGTFDGVFITGFVAVLLAAIF